MANVKITEMTATTALTPDDVLVAVNSTATATRKITKADAWKAMAGDVMADDSYDGPAIAGLNAGETIGQWVPVPSKHCRNLDDFRPDDNGEMACTRIVGKHGECGESAHRGHWRACPQ